MKRKIVVLLSFLFLFVFCGCQLLETSSSSSPVDSAETAAVIIVESTENVVVITVAEKKGAQFLIDVMEQAKADGKLTYEVSNGMITSINGKANPADWSYCWMVYTSDSSMANTAYGTYEYEGQTLGSAVLGAEALPVVDGGIYVWYYQAF